LEPSNSPERKQHLVKPELGTARAQIIAPELLRKLLFPVDNAEAFANAGLRWEAFAPLAGDFKVRVFQILSVVCHTFSVVEGFD
jgi:hypothetical protein